MHIDLGNCQIRSWRRSDAAALVRHANNRKIWRNLRDAFPHPYTAADAERFLDAVMDMEPETLYCISVADEAIGAIGLRLHEDVERISAEIGYWVSEQYWGRGIATAVLKAVTEYGLKTFDLRRIYALPFAWSEASCRVLEKAGYVQEGRLRCSALKDGQVVDQFMYAFTREVAG